MNHRGVNVQGCFREKLHKGFSKGDVIRRVSGVIKELGFDSIRIGGTPMFGASYTHGKGYGWSRYWSNDEVANFHGDDKYANEDYNFNMVALETAKAAGVSVYLTFHKYSHPEEIDEVIRWCAENDVSIAGIARDNEPYLNKRWDTVDATYAKLQDIEGVWPAMYVIEGEQPAGRRQRQEHITNLVGAGYDPGDGIECHVYCPKGYDPTDWIASVGKATREAYATSNVVIGEWSGKNQETFSDDELEAVITEYLRVFDRYSIPNYYQLLGSEHTVHGLWNFITMRPNRGADLFK